MPRFDLAPLDSAQAPTGKHLPPRTSTPDFIEAEETIHLRDVLAVLRRNVWLVAGITALCLGAASYLVFTAVPQYRATGVIRLADTRGAISGGIGDAAAEQMLGKGSDPLLSQLEVLKGRTVLGQVVDREGLRLIAGGSELNGRISDVSVTAPTAEADEVLLEFTDAAMSARTSRAQVTVSYGTPIVLPGLTLTVDRQPGFATASLSIVSRDMAIDRLARSLVARPRDQTDAVEIQFASADPAVAQAVVNTTIEVFQAASAEAAQQQSRRRRLFLEDQLATVDSALATMQVTLSDFRSANQVYSSREKISAQQEGLMGIDVRLEEVAADRRMYQTLLNEIVSGRGNRMDVLRTLVSSPGIASNAVVAQLYGQLVQYETSRDSLVTGSLGATSDHPDVQRLTSLIRATESRLIDAVRSHVSSLDARITALGGLRDRNATEIAGLPATEAEEVRLVQQVETTRQMGDELRAELQKARIAEAVEAGQVELVNTAPLPWEPVSGGRFVKLTLGLVLGLMLGSGAAFLKEHFNTTIRRREEVEELLSVPGLAVIPQIGVGHRAGKLALPGKIVVGSRSRSNGYQKGTDSRELVTVSDHYSSSAEAFRMLRTNLLFSQTASTLKTLVVTSATPGEGKTTTAANLAATFAQQGLRVVLVDCDMRRARLHRMFNIQMSPGLSELILGYASSQEAIRPSDVPNLSVITAGTLPPNPAELLGGARMKRALEVLGESFDLVVLDTPPLMAAADAAILGANADGVLLVVRAGQTERGAAQFAMQQLHGVGARVLGAVLNDPDAQVPLYGGYYYYDYYSSTETVA